MGIVLIKATWGILSTAPISAEHHNKKPDLATGFLKLAVSKIRLVETNGVISAEPGIPASPLGLKGGAIMRSVLKYVST